MQSESNGNGRSINPSGWYKHKETGEKVFLEGTSGIGTPMIDAFIQAGFVYNGVEDTAPVEKLVAETKVVSKK